MDDTAPALVLNEPAHMSMKQCDKYVERGVQVLDANSETTDRCDTKKKEKTKKDTGRDYCWFRCSLVQYGTVSVCDTNNINIKTQERGGE